MAGERTSYPGFPGSFGGPQMSLHGRTSWFHCGPANGRYRRTAACSPATAKRQQLPHTCRSRYPPGPAQLDDGWTPPTASVCPGDGVELPPKEASIEQATMIGLD